jgi:NitT/TauT family transport system substrate-binding protein
MPHAARSVFLAGTAATLAATGAARPARAQTLQKVRIAGVISDLFGEPWYAKASGIFAKAGFDLEVSPMINAGAVAAGIGGGSLEMGTGDLVSGVRAIEAGVPLTIIAGSALQISAENSSFLAVLKDSPIRTVKDLAGKTLAVPTLVGLATSSIRAWLPQNGVPLETVKIVEFPQSGMVAAMQKGSIDAGFLSEPFIVMAKNDVRNLGDPLDAIAKEFLVSVWYASKSWIDADRDRARKIVAAIYDVARWANTHRAETYEILVRDAKLDPERTRGMGRVTFATTLTPALMQPVLNTAAAAKIFDHPVDANSLITRV